MGVITISNLNDGINVKADPTVILDGNLVDCVGFDLTSEGIIESAGGLAANDIAAFLPTGNIQCQSILYIGSTRYILATTSTGLYANATLVKSGFTGRFKGISFTNNIYLVNGTLAIRFDGTTCYKWGIDGPTSVPTIAPGSYLTTIIDDFETLTTWIANEVGCTISGEGTIKKGGSQSMKVAVAASTTGSSFVPYTKDLTAFSNSQASTDKDYIRFWLYVDELKNVTSITLTLDVGDGTFLSDFFSFAIMPSGADPDVQSLAYGQTSPQISQDTTVPITVTPNADDTTTTNPLLQWLGITLPSQQQSVVVTKNVSQSFVAPTNTNQTLSYYTQNDLFFLTSGAWLDIKIPKSLFAQNGDISKGWDTVSNVKIEIVTNANGSVNAYFDDMQLAGGSDLIGQYYFTYSYARADTSGNAIHESAVATANQQFVFAGPITFDRQPLVYTNRPKSTDPQVNAGLITCIGGSLSDFWVLAQIDDNTTTSGTIYNIGDSLVQRILHSRNNQPAPSGTDLVLHQNKIWMVGDPSYSRLLRSSDILGDGTLAPEGWPTRNAYDLEDNQGSLINIGLVNKIPVVKGDSGEWVIQVLDPTDSLQVKAKKVSHLGLIGQDAVISFEASNIYPSYGGFVESNGAQAQFVMPEIQPLIDTTMVSAVGCNAGLVSYFSYQSSLVGTRTAKIDLFRGKPRFSDINNLLLNWLCVDDKTNKVYAVRNGVVYLLDSGYVDESAPGKELQALIKSKAYQVGTKVSWSRLELIHNTGGVWYILNVYIDGELRSATPFKSTSRTTTNFREFGPVSGYTFQFEITGNYITKGIIYLPIRIFHGGK